MKNAAPRARDVWKNPELVGFVFMRLLKVCPRGVNENATA
jgi:hypothetical protein